MRLDDPSACSRRCGARRTGLESSAVTHPVQCPDDVAQQAAQAIAESTGVSQHDIAVVLGSGLSPAAAALGTPTAVLSQAELPGFKPPSAAGHTGELMSVRVGEHRVMVLVGRVHIYEGYEPRHVVHPVRAACAAGARIVVLTNACGGMRPGMTIGQPVLISDHLNLTARSPLVGAQFVDMTDAYSPRLRQLAREVDPELAEGIYAGMPGPSYETLAEIRMLRMLGADMVGMSTVHETIAARAAGAEVLGVSVVTSVAAGLSGWDLSHADVLAAGAASASRIGALLAEVIVRF
jgi:purine-nucleoside phosphorylase